MQIEPQTTIILHILICAIYLLHLLYYTWYIKCQIKGKYLLGNFLVHLPLFFLEFTSKTTYPYNLTGFSSKEMEIYHEGYIYIYIYPPNARSNPDRYLACIDNGCSCRLLQRRSLATQPLTATGGTLSSEGRSVVAATWH
jgi:hypothetical protein